MATLNGERLEELLWEEGLDFEHKTDEFLTHYIAVNVGASVVTVSETYFEQEAWFIDTFNLNITAEYAGKVSGFGDDNVYDEHSLIRRILEVGLDSSDERDWVIANENE